MRREPASLRHTSHNNSLEAVLCFIYCRSRITHQSFRKNMNRFFVIALLLTSMLLVACERAGETTDNSTPPLATLDPNAFPTPTLDPFEPSDEGTDGGGIFEFPPVGGDNPTAEPLPSATVGDGSVPPPVGVTRFTNMRFASSGSGDAQGNFPAGTEEIYAIWDYTGMTANDNMERIWYLNDQVYVQRDQVWPFETYGFTGTVRDIYLYDYIDGIDTGNWRVELWLNGELQASGSFTVGGP